MSLSPSVCSSSSRAVGLYIRIGIELSSALCCCMSAGSGADRVLRLQRVIRSRSASGSGALSVSPSRLSDLFLSLPLQPPPFSQVPALVVVWSVGLWRTRQVTDTREKIERERVLRLSQSPLQYSSSTVLVFCPLPCHLVSHTEQSHAFATTPSPYHYYCGHPARDRCGWWAVCSSSAAVVVVPLLLHQPLQPVRPDISGCLSSLPPPTARASLVFLMLCDPHSMLPNLHPSTHCLRSTSSRASLND